MKGTPIYGWVQTGDNGLIDWSTFTLQKQGAGWLRTYRLVCQCGSDACGEKLNSSTNHFFNTKISQRTAGTFKMDFYYDTHPVRFVVLLNSVQVFDSGYGGLPIYQTELNSFLSTYWLAPATIVPTPVTNLEIAVVPDDIIEVQVVSSFIQPARYWYMYNCIDDGSVDCVLSDWTSWSAWVDNGNGTETKTRTRQVLIQPELNGEPCGNLIEQESRQKISQDCVLSPWSIWTPWVDADFGTQTRSRNRNVTVPPTNGGLPCGALTETESRLKPTDCVLSDWSDWSTWSYIGGGKEQRTRTRQVITQGTEPCGDTIETQVRGANVPITVIFEAENIDDQYRIENGYVGDGITNAVTNPDFNITSQPTTFTGSIKQDTVQISFSQRILTQRDGIRTRINIKNAMGAIISSDEAIDLSNYSKILTFSGEDSLTLKIQIFN